MALVIEDGSIVANANSYVDVTGAIAYAAARGITLPTGQPTEVLLTKAMDYLEAQRARYQGSKVSPAQQLQFPRYDVYIDSELFPYTAIPNLLKQAQMQLAIQVFNGVDLFPTRQSGQFVKKEKVGPIETEYSEAIGSDLAPALLAVDALLEPLYNQNVTGFAITTTRI